MKKIILLVLGLVLLFVQQTNFAIESKTQYIIFIIGVLLLGVPHGAADLLVAIKNADLSSKKFSINRFFVIYVGRLFLFAIVLYFFPVAGNFLFIFFAAYHFGETDLHQFKTQTLLGKLFVIAYGLLILSVILLHHFDEVKPIFQLFESGKQNQYLIDWISQHRYYIISFNGMLFFVSTFIYFLVNKQHHRLDTGYFLVRFACILFILFNLPMLLGFTFYFVVWHSLLSLGMIVNFLRQNDSISINKILKQILLYSFLAIVGIAIFGFSSLAFINQNAITGYLFLGLAVLTAPHMEVMYNMYGAIRKRAYEAT